MTHRKTRRPARRMTAALLSAGVLLALAPGAAQAGSSGAGEINFPTSVTVGQTGLPASISMENRNTFPDEGQTNSVCNLADASPPCDAPEPGVELVPTCKQVASGRCTAAGFDPGVFAISSQGVGRAGSACSGMLVNIVPTDPTTGTVRFEPQPAGTHITLPGFGSRCTIDFTFNVIRTPSGDQDSSPGVQTAQAMRHGQWTGAFGPGALSFFGRTTSNTAPTVLRATPTVSTEASPGVTLGNGALSDRATVSGLVNPAEGSTVTFNLFPPAAGPGCAGAPVFTSTKAVTVAGTTATATSDPYTPTEAGTYRWIATFNGDVNNGVVSGTCGEPSETREVMPVPPPVIAQGACVVTATNPCTAGTARISGRTGCARTAFPVTVRATKATRVVFTVDGRRVRTLTKPNTKDGRYVLGVTPRKLKLGVHRIVATVTFTAASRTATRTLRLTFLRCPAGTPRPVFTGG